MKLILAVVADHDAEPVQQALIAHDLRVTRIASTGGFLRRGNVTLWVGVDDERLEEALGLIRSAVTRGEREPGERRAMVFVLDVARFEQL